MQTEEENVIRQVLDEMKDAHGIVAFWLRGSSIDKTLADWIHKLESLLK